LVDDVLVFFMNYRHLYEKDDQGSSEKSLSPCTNGSSFGRGRSGKVSAGKFMGSPLESVVSCR
jgi:hypothetical protein